jgi:7,8-dihydro-6-hydroxymethylpterin dimethyltransferase
LQETQSVCPECLRRTPARKVTQGSDIYLEKTCPEHGSFRTIVWRGSPGFESWLQQSAPPKPSPLPHDCPGGCAACAAHGQQPCCVLLEVTQSCDLACTFCFASAGGSTELDPSLKTIKGWYARLLEAGGPFNVQLSGGEPCLRDDLPEIVAMGQSMGFPFIQVNTNGLRIARDSAYLERLAAAGLSTVYLQFDATDDTVYERLRGARLFDLKRQAIEQCIKLKIGIVLVATIVPRINTHELGSIIKFALQYSPALRGVHFQPVSYFGRYGRTPENAGRITLPEVMQAIAAQTGGLVNVSALRPAASEHTLCSFHGNYVNMPDGRLQPLGNNGPSDCCTPSSAAKARNFVARAWSYPRPAQATAGLSLGGWDDFLERALTHLFTISGMAFQDAWTLDLERLHRCHIFVMSPKGNLVPFCIYNLTSSSGQSLYRGCTQERL